ncbi:AAA family ATPase [Phaeocystidibacter luteus]|uniref:ATP-binding protein n=1 Tax=Phaeocystidibacter luteus TaxID=911197 RepID=A0A6N6RJA4_9FLAO|nr:ATP-binding protein [Phaeocystidibacter luteus]KAB2814076.1 ATP-binding protein [Phaeocystidibacter luteus]
MPKTVVITGPESTGKSTIAKAMASELEAAYVDEMAREYLENLGRSYDESDMHKMSALQLDSQLTALRSDAGILVCDTDLLTFIIWWEVKYGLCPQKWVDLWKSNQPDVYLLMDIDLEWEEDPLREHPTRREELMERYVEKLKTVDTPYHIVSGQGKDRLANAKRALKALL